MSDSGAGADDEAETVQVELPLSQSLLDDIDAAWQEGEFSSRSEFLRHAARDAVTHPAFSRAGWKQVAASEHGLRVGGEELVSREEVVETMGRDEDDG